MGWITTIDETQAVGDLKQIYDEQRDKAGAVANILKIHSLAPEVLQAHLAIYHPPCTRRENLRVLSVR